MKHSVLRNNLPRCVAFCVLFLLAVAVPGQKTNLPAPDAFVVGQLPAVDPVSIPLTDPVWVKDGFQLREVVPGTEAYYNLRVKNARHVENDKLVPSVCVEGEVLQILPGSQLWVRKLSLSRCKGGEGDYVGYAESDSLVVEVPDTNGFTAGTVQQFQLRPSTRPVAVTLADGTIVRASGCDQVFSPTLEQYVAMFSSGQSTAVTVSAVVEVSEVSEPVLHDVAGRVPVPADQDGMMHSPAYTRMPGDPASREFRINEMTREQADVSDLIRRRNIVIEQLERDMDRTTDPAERSALEEAVRRARERSAEMEARVICVSNAQMEARGDLKPGDPVSSRK